MSDMQYRPTYAPFPWAVPPAPEAAREVFMREGEPFELPRGRFLDFGRADAAWLVEDGLLATYSKNFTSAMRYVGLFGPLSVLGGTRALRNGGAPMRLAARVLSRARGRRISGERYRRLLEEPAGAERMLRWCLSTAETQLEGMAVNDLYPVEARMRLALAALFTAAGCSPAVTELPAELPWEITVTDLAQLVHADRPLVSRILSGWQKEGLVSKPGRRIILLADPLGARKSQSRPIG